MLAFSRCTCGYTGSLRFIFLILVFSFGYTGVSVAACEVFSWGMWTLSCCRWDLVPWPGIELGLPPLSIATGHPETPQIHLYPEIIFKKIENWSLLETYCASSGKDGTMGPSRSQKAGQRGVASRVSVFIVRSNTSLWSNLFFFFCKKSCITSCWPPMG